MNCTVPPSQLARDLELTGLVGMSPTAPQLLTGIASGPVRVALQALDSTPQEVEDGWDDIGEVSLDVADGPLLLTGAMDNPLPDAPRLDAHGPGTYRLRIHGRNRDVDYDLTVSDTLEEYLILSWMARAARPESLALSSSVGSSNVASATRAAENPRPDYAAAVTTGSVRRRVDIRQNLRRHTPPPDGQSPPRAIP